MSDTKSGKSKSCFTCWLILLAIAIFGILASIAFYEVNKPRYLSPVKQNNDMKVSSKKDCPCAEMKVPGKKKTGNKIVHKETKHIVAKQPPLEKLIGAESFYAKQFGPEESFEGKGKASVSKVSKTELTVNVTINTVEEKIGCYSAYGCGRVSYAQDYPPDQSTGNYQQFGVWQLPHTGAGRTNYANETEGNYQNHGVWQLGQNAGNNNWHPETTGSVGVATTTATINYYQQNPGISNPITQPANTGGGVGVNTSGNNPGVYTPPSGAKVL